MLTILEYFAAGSQKCTEEFDWCCCGGVVAAEVLQHRREPRQFLGLCVAHGSVGMVTSLESRRAAMACPGAAGGRLVGWLGVAGPIRRG